METKIVIISIPETHELFGKTEKIEILCEDNFSYKFFTSLKDLKNLFSQETECMYFIFDTVLESYKHDYSLNEIFVKVYLSKKGSDGQAKITFCVYTEHYKEEKTVIFHTKPRLIRKKHENIVLNTFNTILKNYDKLGYFDEKDE
jgi:hypothetical protein